MLEMLERANLFLIPLDDERQWYRYHHLFADFLRKRLHQRHPEMEPDLHRRASEWYEQEGLLSEAVGHALKAEDFERAASLIERVYKPMLMRGELTTLLGWLDMLPEGLFRSRPQLCLACAVTFFSLGRLEDVEPYLRDAERLLRLDGAAETSMNSLEPAENKEVASLRGEALAIRAFFIATLQEDWYQSIALSHQALNLLNEDNLFMRSFVVATLASEHFFSRGDTEAASQALEEAITLSQATNAPYTTAVFIRGLANLQVVQGRLREAEEIYRQALRFAAEHGEGTLSSTTSITHMRMGEVLYEQNDLENAERHLLKGIELYERSGSVHYDAFYGYMALARVKHIQADTDAAFEAIQKAKQVAQQATHSVYVRQMRAWQAREWVGQGDLIAAARWAEESGLSAEDEPDYPREFEHITLARLLIAQGEHYKALGLLERLLEAAKAGRRTGTVIELLVLKALALQAKNYMPNALAALRRALALAEPEGYVRTFIDEGTLMAALLKQFFKAHKTQQTGAAESVVSLEYVGKLLEALGEDVKVSTKVRPRRKAGLLVEPITERELEVLKLLAADLSNSEIARKLYVSSETVKSHLKHIYGKLGVRSRYRAVDRARELDILR
jgi:LuxR family maltose regulon positive regulatory protein